MLEIAEKHKWRYETVEEGWPRVAVETIDEEMEKTDEMEGSETEAIIYDLPGTGKNFCTARLSL